VIRDNGMESNLNRGDFYSFRDTEGKLEGVALIGHATLMETSSSRALEAFADIARQCSRTHVIMAEQERIEEFWSYYSRYGEEMRLSCREALFDLRWPIEALSQIEGLRPATMNDLDLVMPVHAQMAFEECGVNPLERDPQGFRERCVRRIQRGRTYVWVEEGKLIFKADIVSETPEATYLEGMYVSPEHRGKGYGQRCLSQLARILLNQTDSICILVNENNPEGQAFYRKAGFTLQGYYDTIYLHLRNPVID
jgi:GNAT superfamily N-acetyltransferase